MQKKIFILLFTFLSFFSLTQENQQKIKGVLVYQYIDIPEYMQVIDTITLESFGVTFISNRGYDVYDVLNNRIPKLKRKYPN